jgi:hypothetical protein
MFNVSSEWRNQVKIESADRKASMEIVGDSVIISSSGAAVMLARGIQGQRSIAIRSITSVQVKLGTMFVPGYINLSYPGGKEFRGGVMAATQDPDTLIFNRAINAGVEKFAAESIVSEHPFSGLPGLCSRRPMRSRNWSNYTRAAPFPTRSSRQPSEKHFSIISRGDG